MSENSHFKEGFYAEQGPEEIRALLENAADQGIRVRLTVESPVEGQEPRVQKVLPWAFEDGFLWVETIEGEGMQIELSRIKMVQLPEQEKDHG